MEETMDKALIKGYSMTFLAYVIWGIMPIYWKQLTEIMALELISMRIVITVITLLLFVLMAKQKEFLVYMKHSKIRKQLLVSSFFIAVNWGIFVYAVNAGYMVQASLGYYMNPLISVFLGIFILKEKLTKPQYISLAFAALGVLFLTISYGQLPWISLILGGTFALYGLFKKVYHLNSINSLLVETIYLLPISILALLWTQVNSLWIKDISISTWIILTLAGLITAIPLVLFSDGAKLIPLSAVGFLQYVAPTLMLLIGVVLYKEKFTFIHKISFSFIWLGLLVYSGSLIKKSDVRISK
jgi:chloramphenicol-sensitive protein RarD